VGAGEQDPSNVTDETTIQKTFRDFDLDDRLVDELESQGITNPFPIQELTLPMAIKGHDIIGQARTGTGKTLGFGLPLLQRVDPELERTQALVIVPTRELCLQVADDLGIGSTRGVRVQTVYGGVGYDEQIEALTSGVHVVVGTPGRLLDHLNKGVLDLRECRIVVLDEADEMLDMGFLPDVERIIAGAPSEGRHTMLFSATMPSAVVKLARRYMTHPTFMRADVEEHETAPTVEQHFFMVHRMDKPRVLARILQSPERGAVYVFTRTKRMADRLVDELEKLSVDAIAIHGDLRQAARERNMDKFREGKVSVLVATEVAARGLDVENVTHVVNYDCPDDEKMYLHRIGRTARAGASGVAITFAEFNEADRLNVIRKAVDAEREVVEVFSTSDELTELFDLPDETPWAHLSKRKADRSSGGGDQRRSGGRKGSTDGRNKSSSSSQGGGERARSRRPRPQPEREKSSPAEAIDVPTTSEERDERAEEVRTRTRTRARVRQDGGSRGSGGGSKSGGAEDDHSNGGASKSSGSKSSSSRNGGSKSSESKSSSSRSSGSKGGSAEDDSSEGSGSKSGGSSEDGGSRGGSGDGRSRTRARSRDRRSDDRGNGGGGSDRRQGSGRREGERSGGNRGSSSSKGRDRSGRGGDGDDRRDRTVRPTRSGDDARGEGTPRLGRRVKVEHLP
jgi:superfamily II DNA/RNA helicase